jgi:hypothetical protein
VDVSDFSHLHAATRTIIDESPESRIRRIRTDRWITYARAEMALSAMEDLLTFPKRTRMPNLLLVGPTNNGKTMIVEKLRRRHLPFAANTTPDGAASIPILKVQMPPGPDERRFFGAISEELGFPHLFNERVAGRQEAVMRTLRTSNVRVLVIDEVHNVLSGTRLQQRRLLNLLRWLGTSCRFRSLQWARPKRYTPSRAMTSWQTASSRLPCRRGVVERSSASC